MKHQRALNRSATRSVNRAVGFFKILVLVLAGLGLGPSEVARAAALPSEGGQTYSPSSFPSIQSLIDQGLLINQIDPRAQLALGGSCGPSSVVNALQLLRKRLGRPLFANLYEVLDRVIALRPEMASNGTSSPLEIFDSLQDQLYAGGDLETEVQVELVFHEEFWGYPIVPEGVSLVASIDTKVLLPRSDQELIIGMISITNAEGEIQVGHAFLIHGSSEGELEILDSNPPFLITTQVAPAFFPLRFEGFEFPLRTVLLALEASQEPFYSWRRVNAWEHFVFDSFIRIRW